MTKLHKITIEDVNDVLQAYEATNDPSMVAEEMGLHLNEVLRVLRTEGVLVEKPRSNLLDSFTPERLQEFIEDYGDRMRVRDMVNKYGLSDTATVYYLLRQLNIAPRTWPTNARIIAKEDQMTHALELYQHSLGMTIADICSETGVQQVTLHDEIHKRGIPFRRPSRTSAAQSVRLAAREAAIADANK